jgi:16S rRNA (guanine527-N7)-methyltransferase
VFHVKREGLLAEYVELVRASATSITASGATRDELWDRLVGDALTALEDVRAVEGTIIDVGSGNGSPGVPLAVELDRPVTLLEARHSKARVLARMLRELGLPGEVVNERAEVHARCAGRDAYAIGLARALAPPVVALELALPLVAVGGRLVLWTGSVELEELAGVAAQLGGRLDRWRRTGESRGLAIVAKDDPTPERFPRRPGVAGKRPLRSLPSTA